MPGRIPCVQQEVSRLLSCIWLQSARIAWRTSLLRHACCRQLHALCSICTPPTMECHLHPIPSTHGAAAHPLPSCPRWTLQCPLRLPTGRVSLLCAGNSEARSQLQHRPKRPQSACQHITAPMHGRTQMACRRCLPASCRLRPLGMPPLQRPSAQSCAWLPPARCA
jgi:hypothetical protein